MNNAHLHFHLGNVIKAPESGDLWIVTEVTDRVISAVSFDCENCSATARLDDYAHQRACHCGDHPDFMGVPQEDCDQCHGTGRYTVHVKGWSRAKVVAPTVKDFILKGVKRQFGF